MRQATLVAFYGDKPSALVDLVLACQRTLWAELEDVFRPYPLAQVHATLVGLERTPGTELENHAFARLRSESRTMDIAAFVAALKVSQRLPLHVQLGGFADRDYPFESRGQRPYARSFSIQRDRAVLVGWPVRPLPGRTGAFPPDPSRESGSYPASLDELRRSAQSFGILHAYHPSPSDVDNDFYLRLGLLRGPLESGRVARLEDRLRSELAAREAAVIAVGVPDLYLVSYEADTLPPQTSRVARLDALSASEIESWLWG